MANEFKINQPLPYKITPTGSIVHNSDKKIVFVCGPFGSGKSVMCSKDLELHALKQKPAANGVIYTRYAVIRSTYPALRTTTKKTIEQVFPPTLGRITDSIPMIGTYRYTFENNKTKEKLRVQIELILLSIDGSPESIEKLKSLDLTGAWVNEADGVPYEVITALNERVGRFPIGEYGAVTSAKILCDYNRPPFGHWLVDLEKTWRSGEKSDGSELSDEELAILDLMEFVSQPPAVFKHIHEDGTFTYELNPEAENLENLNSEGKDYYGDQIKTNVAVGNYDYIDRLLCLQDGADKSGKPVYEKSFNRIEHVVGGVSPINGAPVYIGMDTSGINPCAVIAQPFNQRFVIMHELYGENVGFQAFIDDILIPTLATHYSKSTVVAICDPANQRDAWTGVTPVTRLQEAGIDAKVASTNSPVTRINQSVAMLNKRIGGIIIRKECVQLIAALGGGYKYKKISVVDGRPVYDSTPIKNQYSHYADSFQYLCLGLLSTGEYDAQTVQIKKMVNYKLRGAISL